MKAWDARPAEVAHLLNPAFCGLVLRNVVAGYRKEGGLEVDLALLFIALPLVLHAPSRRALPGTVSTRLHTWIESHADLKVGMAERTRSLVSYTKEALAFGCQHGLLHITSTGGVAATTDKKTKAPLPTEEASAIVSAGYFAGRWLQPAGDSATVYTMFGLRP